jgi:O-acetylhomoserine (thiol)-lyase
MNPTTAAFEERVASLEGGIGAVATGSGQAAQFLTLFTMLRAGDHVLSSRALYGGTTTQFKHVLGKLGIEVSFVDPDNPDHWRAALHPNTRVLYGETIGNPSGNVLDLDPIARIAHAHGVPFVVDNTFASPYLCRPFEWGADIVVHSATKFLGGHGVSIGGVVVDSGRFDWGNGKFPGLVDPSPNYHGLMFYETFGMYGFLQKLRSESMRDLGAPLSPFNAFTFLLGLETLPLRMERHVQNTLGVARFLEGHPAVAWVRYSGLPSSPYRPLVEKYLPKGAGAVFSFGIKGGRAAGQRFIEALQLFSHLANVGDAKSLVIHPASTTHRQLSDEELIAAGVGPEAIRLSIGLETLDDLLDDLDQALRISQEISAPTPIIAGGEGG